LVENEGESTREGGAPFPLLFEKGNFTTPR
jgi:hypothetical protein